MSDDDDCPRACLSVLMLTPIPITRLNPRVMTPHTSIFMGSLFLVELSSFLAKTTQSTIVVDFNRDQQVGPAAVGVRWLD